jgi:hypothetical protein
VIAAEAAADLQRGQRDSEHRGGIVRHLLFPLTGKIAGEEIRMKLTAPDGRFAHEQRIKQTALELKNVSEFMGATMPARAAPMKRALLQSGGARRRS